MTRVRVCVRPAAPDDVDALAPVDRVVQRRRYLEHIGDAPDSAALVAIVDDSIVGHAWVDVTPYRVAGLGMLVDAGWRGVGQPAVSYAT